MKKAELQKKIKRLLKSSTISPMHKSRTTHLLPEMDLKSLQNIYKTLSKENVSMAKLDKREKRLKFKFQMIVEKISGLGKKEK